MKPVVTMRAAICNRTMGELYSLPVKSKSIWHLPQGIVLRTKDNHILTLHKCHLLLLLLMLSLLLSDNGGERHGSCPWGIHSLVAKADMELEAEWWKWDCGDATEETLQFCLREKRLPGEAGPFSSGCEWCLRFEWSKRGEKDILSRWESCHLNWLDWLKHAWEITVMNRRLMWACYRSPGPSQVGLCVLFHRPWMWF